MTGVPSSPPRIPDLIRKGAPPSVIEKGIELASTGAVIECSRSGHRINGAIRENSGEIVSTSISISGGNISEVSCSCSTPDDIAEQWCKHIVALTSRASDLGFFESSAGFQSARASDEIPTGESIADVMREILHFESPNSEVARPVHVSLFIGQNELEIALHKDRVLLTPQVVSEDKHLTNHFAIDSILFEALDRDGEWKEDRWLVSTPSAISRILAVISTYDEILDGKTGLPITIEPETLRLQLDLEWREFELIASVSYLLPNGKSVSPCTDVIGEKVLWIGTKKGATRRLYRIEERMMRLASLFRRPRPQSIPLRSTGPILEVLQEAPRSPFITVAGAKLQPEGKVVAPDPRLNLELRENQFEHFASNTRLEIVGELLFDYPESTSKRVVHLPDRAFEAACKYKLIESGFAYAEERRRFVVSGEDALEIISRGKDAFPPTWSICGLEELQKKIRFTDVKLSVLVRSSSQDRFDCEVLMRQGRTPLELRSFFKAAHHDAKRWVRLENGFYAKVPGENLLHLKNTLGLLDPSFRLRASLKVELSPPQAIALSTLDGAGIQLELDSAASDLSAQLRTFSGISAVKPSRAFKGKLRCYQEEGVGWLKFLHRYKFGGILADEMGLGKTVQTLAFIQTLQQEAKKSGVRMKPVLIVTPTSVTSNWLHEAKRFTPSLSTLLLHGPKRKALFASIPSFDIVITSFALLRFDRLELERHEFSYVILDEAQLIKNPVATTTRAAKSLKSDHRLALTGTPTENRPLELWSIFDFVMPGYLGSSEFFKANIERVMVDSKGDPGITIFLNQRTKPFILRRLKSEVEKELPPKVESPLYVSMTPSQSRLYDEILSDVKPKILETASKRGVGASTVSILAALLRLRQVCNHPNSLPSLLDATGYESGKFNLFQELVLEALSNNRKILVYSQFLDMLAIMRRWLEDEKIAHLYLDGSTDNRQDLVDRFNADESIRIFLVSLKAGGTGLNLTAADTVVIYDPWWNPAVEAQAVDRAHRIGQTKAISVYRLITEDSIEEKILALKARKSKLIDSLITDNRMSSLDLTLEDLETLFSGKNP